MYTLACFHSFSTFFICWQALLKTFLCKFHMDQYVEVFDSGGPLIRGTNICVTSHNFFNVNAPLCAYCTFSIYQRHHASPSPHPCLAAASSVVSTASSSRLWEQQGPQYKHSVSLTAHPSHEPCELTLPPRHLQAAKISNWCALMFREFTLPAPYTSFTVTIPAVVQDGGGCIEKITALQTCMVSICQHEH